MEMVLLDVSHLNLPSNYLPSNRLMTTKHRNLPIGALVLILLSLFLRIKGKENESRKLPFKQKLANTDPVGCFVFIGAVCCLLLALQWGGQSKPWRSSMVIGLLVGFIALGCLFVYLQWRRQDRALISLRVFRKRSIFTGAMVLFFLGASTYLVFFALPSSGPIADTLIRMSFSYLFISKPQKVWVPPPVVKILYRFCYLRW